MQKLYLHIGQPKTGTSALQAFFSRNRKKMEEDGVHYPQLNADYKLEEKIQFFAGNGNSFMRLNKESASMSQQETILWNELIKKLKMINKDILISNEGLWEGETCLYHNLKREGFDVKVIVYLRRQDRWCEAYWSQIVKAENYSKTCFEYATSDAQLDYYNYLLKIADVIGKENIIVRVYDKVCENGNAIFKDFMSIFGIKDISNYQFDEYQANPSLSANIIEIKRIFNSLEGSDLLKEEVREILSREKEFAKTSNSVRNAPRFLHIDERRTILEQCHEKNVKLAKMFLGRDLLFNDYIDDNEQEICSVHYSDIIRFFGMLVIRQYLELENLKMNNYCFNIPDFCQGKKIAVYGIDSIGRILLKQLANSNKYEDVIAVDKRWRYFKQYGINVLDPETVNFHRIDYILIAVKNEKTYESIKKYLLSEEKIEEEKILRII